MAATGSAQTRLLVLRGNSGAGKTTVASLLRAEVGPGLALIEQDHIRRHILRERDRVDAGNVALIEAMARSCLDSGYHVVVEGILDSGRYGRMLRQLTADHLGVTLHVYLDASFDECARRHAMRPQRDEFTLGDMHGWYREKDLLADVPHLVVPETVPAGEAAIEIVQAAGLPGLDSGWVRPEAAR